MKVFLIVVALLAILWGSLRADNIEPRFMRSDVDGDGQVCMNDAVILLRSMWGVGPEIGCLDSADSNDDGYVDLSDVIDILNILFRDGDRYLYISVCDRDCTPDMIDCEEPPNTCNQGPYQGL